MARKKKEFNKNGTFQTRFKRKFYESDLTQEALANVLGVSRPTLVGWLEGKNLPDILSLEKIARYFEVSADYLLGLSEAESPDISVRAAAEYTGLSEEAVKRLHNGLFDPARKLNGWHKRVKEDNLYMASMLIESDDFQKIIENIAAVAKEAYMEKSMTLLAKRYFKLSAHFANSECNDTNDEERNIGIAKLSRILEMTGSKANKNILNKLPEMNNNEIVGNVYEALTKVKNANEIHQFHATKALNGYIDQVAREGQKLAEQDIEEK